ncbi:MAG: ribonuclease P protein component [Bacteroidales bacterium]
MAEVTSKNTISNALFPKSGRLCKKKDIERLFVDGQIFRIDDMKIYYRIIKHNSDNIPCKILISVPKKQQPLAVKRNKIKRLIREAWRKNKNDLYHMLSHHDVMLHVAVVIFATNIPAYTEIESKIILTLQHLINASSKTQ